MNSIARIQVMLLIFDFSVLFAETWRRAMTQRNFTGGFRITGIYPFNRSE